MAEGEPKLSQNFVEFTATSYLSNKDELKTLLGIFIRDVNRKGLLAKRLSRKDIQALLDNVASVVSGQQPLAKLPRIPLNTGLGGYQEADADSSGADSTTGGAD
jgi:hypothetical protein